MARPRKYAQVNGETIDGVHLHRSSGRFYILDERRKQVYFRDPQAARDALCIPKTSSGRIRETDGEDGR